jgi:hypothetical protein
VHRTGERNVGFARRGPNTILSAFVAIAALSHVLAVDAPENRRVVEAAKNVLRRVGKEPNDYVATVLLLHPSDRRIAPAEGVYTAPTVRFEPLDPRKAYALWVAGSGSEVEWWLDDRPLTPAQQAVTEVVCHYFPLCQPERLDYREVRVRESAACVEFSFEPPVAQEGSLIVEDTIVYFDKKLLKVTEGCGMPPNTHYEDKRDSGP